MGAFSWEAAAMVAGAAAAALAASTDSAATDGGNTYACAHLLCDLCRALAAKGRLFAASPLGFLRRRGACVLITHDPTSGIVHPQRGHPAREPGLRAQAVVKAAPQGRRLRGPLLSWVNVFSTIRNSRARSRSLCEQSCTKRSPWGEGGGSPTPPPVFSCLWSGVITVTLTNSNSN